MMSYQPGTPAWVDLATSDPDGARAFYGELLGWEFDIGAPETGHYTMCRVRGRSPAPTDPPAGHNVAGIVGDPAPDGMPTAWTMYLATDDADRIAKLVTEHGGGLMMGPLDVGPQGRVTVATDPAGAVFGLWQAGEHVGATLVNEPGSVVWNELATRDLAAVQDFYSHLFGYTWDAVDTGEGGPPYYTLQSDGRTVAGAMQMTADWPPDVPPHWMTYFAVGDTDAAVSTAERLGGQVRVPPTDSPYGRFSVLADPQGGVFSAIEASGAS